MCDVLWRFSMNGRSWSRRLRRRRVELGSRRSLEALKGETVSMSLAAM
jgi:hypothetical protein